MGFLTHALRHAFAVALITVLTHGRSLRMSCALKKHKWIYDLRFYHVFRKCQACGQVQRHVWNIESVYTDWEPIREANYVESQQKQIFRAPSSLASRVAHTLGFLRSRTIDRRRFWKSWT